MVLWCCDQCEFEFFIHDPTSSLAAGRLDESRLKASGLDIPTRDADFANGVKQSQQYIDEYFNADDKGANILEVGCSWGYFLKLVRDAGASPFGVEVNSLRAQYVRDDLKIPCFSGIEPCESSGLRFRKIFLFYVLEYIPQPVNYLQRLLGLLEDSGFLIVITPNVHDPLKNLYHNEGFLKFCYDEHSINYFSVKSMEEIAKTIQSKEQKIDTRQGYSFINHINWFLTKAPRTTNMVGGDNFVRDFIASLHPDSKYIPGRESRERAVAKELADVIIEFDYRYRQILEKNGYGNQIRFIVNK